MNQWEAPCLIVFASVLLRLSACIGVVLLSQGPFLQRAGHRARGVVRWSHQARVFVSRGNATNITGSTQCLPRYSREEILA